MSKHWLGLDIGGANLKAATSDGWCHSQPFALWQKPNQLANALSEIIRSAPDHRYIAATMTGELADCFSTKAEGVRFIVQAIQESAPLRAVSIYLVDGSFVNPEIACERPLLAAASNWHALASLVGRQLRNGDELILMDVGSTTCDIIPISAGKPVAVGATDPERLASGELVYTGVVRTPICAVVREIPWRGQPCPVAAEVFSTTGDAYLMLGDLPESAQRKDTADGRPATRDYARDRMARTICADRTMFSEQDANLAARAVRDAQRSLLTAALNRVWSRASKQPTTIVVSGEGEFLSRAVVQATNFAGEMVSLSERLGPGLSACAPAYAVAMLAAGAES